MFCHSRALILSETVRLRSSFPTAGVPAVVRSLRHLSRPVDVVPPSLRPFAEIFAVFQEADLEPGTDLNPGDAHHPGTSIF